MERVSDRLYFSKKNGVIMVRVGHRWFSLEAVGEFDYSTFKLPILTYNDDGREFEFIHTDIDEVERIPTKAIIDSSSVKKTKN